MPATFAHCLMAKQSIDTLMNMVRADATKSAALGAATQLLGKHNSFVVLGAVSPDYPYLTDILTTSVLQIGHTWANRMHYEGVAGFIHEGVRRLAAMDRTGDSFGMCLAWFCGYVSHVVADVYVHPVVNTIVHGPYVFTHKEHAACELAQDIHIFHTKTGDDIVKANPREGTFAFLRILDDCSAPKQPDRLHPAVGQFWRELLEAAHPQASAYFAGIDPDRWHYNYRGRVNFVVDPGAIFRHLCGMAGFDYKAAADLTAEERQRYVEQAAMPDGTIAHYDAVFDATVGRIVERWQSLLADVAANTPANVAHYIHDWNLDSGVDEARRDLWPTGA
jgi:hypothetical protein